jgi:DNA-binding NarL/FixJ family response regulator
MQIAAELSISENTVKRHVNNIFKKTETQSRHEIIYKISNIHEIDL